MPAPRAYPDRRITDQDQIARRRERARKENPRIENRDPRFPVFSNFDVHSQTGITYSVEVRDLAWRQFHCTCVDFRVNGLGTCKHAEAVLLHLAQALPAAEAAGSLRLDLLADAPRQSLRCEIEPTRLPRGLRRLLDGEGHLLSDVMPELAVQAWREAAQALPELRVSQEVDVLLENRRRAAEAISLRRTYEQKVRAREWPPHETRIPLYPYQREGMLHLACVERALLADEMGLGKTAQAIAACALLRRLGRASRVLVVTPASLLGEWAEQIARFTRLAARQIEGPRSARLTQYAADGAAFFTLATYEQMLADHLEVNAQLRPDIVILDEAQRIKNWHTRTALAVKRLESRYAFVLTGSPLENKIDEIYSLVSFLDPAVLGPLFRFNREFYEFDQHGKPRAVRNLERLRNRLRPILLRRRKADVAAQLPSRTDRTLLVDLTVTQRARYAALEADVARLIAAAKKRPLTAPQNERVFRLVSQMRMLCDAPFLLDPVDRTSPKIAEFSRLLAGLAVEKDVKVLVFSEWDRMLELASEACIRLRLGLAWHTGSVPAAERREEIRRFREDPNCRIFLSTDSGATGLSLPVASVVIHLDVPWNPARFEQRTARAWSSNQQRPVTVVRLVARDTIEHRLTASLAGREVLADSVLDGRPAPASWPIDRTRADTLERIAALLPTKLPPKPPAPVPESPGLVEERLRAVAEKIGLVLLEEREPAAGAGDAVLFAVVRGDPIGARAELAAVFGEGASARLEIVDEPTHYAIERLAASGLVAPTHHVTRRFWPVPGPRSREARAKKFFADLKAQLSDEPELVPAGEAFPTS